MSKEGTQPVESNEIPRRDFLKLAGYSAFAVSGVGRFVPQASAAAFVQLVPADKHLDPGWVASLTDRGRRTVYRGNDLRFIGMPIGGICAGQVYLGGDGKLWLWDIFNRIKFGVVEKTVLFRGSQLNAGGGANYVAPPEQVHPFEHDFILTIVKDGEPKMRPLDFRGWHDIRFSGEYPMGFVSYADDDEKVGVELEAFSPFVPLNEDDSGLPATIKRYVVTNHGDMPVDVTIHARMANAIGLNTFKPDEAMHVTEKLVAADHLGITFLARPSHPSVPGAIPQDPKNIPLRERPDFGTMNLALLGHDPTDSATIGGKNPTDGEISRHRRLAPGESMEAIFVVCWHFPNFTLPKLGAVGHWYTKRFRDSGDVAAYIAAQYPRLYRDTKLWHDTWYDSTLPYWFLDRTMGNTATLSTMTAARFANGRFYGWEGIGCCEGTCGHVWLYAQAVARLFPQLERTVREMVDFGVAYHKDTGIIDFRGEYGDGYATDAQAGYVLRTYREHQMSGDDAFLRRVYPWAKGALLYLIAQDTKQEGVIRNGQHNTLDVDLYGPSSWLTSLYLAALRAGSLMAAEMRDPEFGTLCLRIFEAGTKAFVPTFWNGDYFVHLPDPTHPEALRYGDGCEIDQVMGQSYAWQLGLGRVIEEDHCRKALAALWRNNFLPDVGPYRDKQKPGRWYATPGEAGLLMCTFPKGDREAILGNKPTWASAYFNECMTGFEYEAASHMVAEGMVTEGMAITRAVHDRYSATKRNPWNEVECSDHYARCMAVYGVFVTACGFAYHGPSGHIGFSPRIEPENFRAPFTAAEGWGTYSQHLAKSGLDATIEVKHGQLRVASISLGLPEGMRAQTVRIRYGKVGLACQFSPNARGVDIKLTQEVTLLLGQKLEVLVA